MTFCASTKISRPNAATRELWHGIQGIANDPEYASITMGVRQVYYQCVVRGVVPENSARQYRRVQRAVLQMRRQGEIPWWRIRDGTRDRHSYPQHTSLHSAFGKWAAAYRRDAMQHQPRHIELWIEKDSLAGFIATVANEYGLTYAPLRGQPSESFLWEAGDAWHKLGKSVTVLYAGDFDSTGYFIGETLEARARVHYDQVRVIHLGLNAELVHQHNLPPSFEAKHTDRRTPEFVRRFGRHCVELDALPPVALKGLYTDAIERLIDKDAYQRARMIEAQERETLRSIAHQTRQAI